MVWSVLISLFGSRVSLEAEILILRHQAIDEGAATHSVERGNWRSREINVAGSVSLLYLDLKELRKSSRGAPTFAQSSVALVNRPPSAL